MQLLVEASRANSWDKVVGPCTVMPSNQELTLADPQHNVAGKGSRSMLLDSFDRMVQQHSFDALISDASDFTSSLSYVPQNPAWPVLPSASCLASPHSSHL